MLGVLVFPRATAALVRAHVPSDASVIAVDAGAEACLAADVVPAWIVGDMDSVSSATLETLARRGARLARHPPDKRDTDAALALAQVADHERILFLGALGGRPDHALANLHLLARASTRADAHAVDKEGETWVVTSERPLTLRLPEGTVVSAIPFDAEVEGITYEGLAYPLFNATMRSGDPYGVSNVTTGAEQRIRVRKGRLFVMRPTQGIS